MVRKKMHQTAIGYNKIFYITALKLTNIEIFGTKMHHLANQYVRMYFDDVCCNQDSKLKKKLTLLHRFYRSGRLELPLGTYVIWNPNLVKFGELA
jgi:hypothetical protein